MNPLRLPGPSRLGRPRTEDNKDSTPEAKDRVVQQTDQDASQSRLSAVETGYLHDPFARVFVNGGVQRKLPLINRGQYRSTNLLPQCAFPLTTASGTYVRTTAIDKLVDRFVNSSSQAKQIVSLGAGSDTRYFRIKTTNPTAASSLIYHELDFTAVTSRKIASLSKGEPSLIASLLSDPELVIDTSAGSLKSQKYFIHPIDLRNIHPGCVLPVGIDKSLPTLFISECCLIYLAPTEADNILKWTTQDFTSSVGLVLYEPIGGEDAFGKVMIQNLAARGIVLKTLKKYSSLERQKERLRLLGFSQGQGAADVEFIHDFWASSDERERIAKLEMLDEMEEWQLLARHYCVAWGWRGGDGFSGWEGELPVQTYSKI